MQQGLFYLYESIMKIGIVLYPTYGGSGVVATELGKALAIKGHEVHFMSYRLPARLPQFIDNVYFHEVGVSSYPLFEYPPYESALAAKIVDVVEYEKLDVLHVHYAIPHASAGFMAKQILQTKGKRIPMVTTLHGTDITIVGKDASLKPVVEFSINQSDAVTTVSDNLRQTTYDNFAITKEIEVVPNFVDIERFSISKIDAIRNRLAFPDEKIVMHVSNFRKVKRIQDIIEAFAQIQDQVNGKLVLVGDGPERQQLEQMSRDKKLCSVLRFIGKQEAVNELLSVADVFVMASERESFGLAALEAMAAGVPVITSDAGGLPELNIHKKTGIVYPVGNVAKLSEAMLTMLTQDQLLHEYSLQAKQRAMDFSTQKIVPLYEAVYQSVLD